MTFHLILCFLFILLALSVIFVRNPIHSVLSLMLLFVNATFWLISIGSDFMAFIFLMVYVGAIIVLFLFIVMMLEIKILEWSQFLYKFAPLTLFLTIYLYSMYNLNIDTFLMKIYTSPYKDFFSQLNESPLINLIGTSMYDIYAFPFIISGFILLLALIAAIVLTLEKRFFVKRQNISSQIRRNASETIYLF